MNFANFLNTWKCIFGGGCKFFNTCKGIFGWVGMKHSCAGVFPGKIVGFRCWQV
jgi:hypothetical protein